VKEGREKGDWRRFRLAIAGAGVAFVALLFYVLTLAPGVMYYDRPIFLDSVMLQVQATVLGMTGPTGEPSWVMLTHLFTYLPVGDEAYRVNLASAVYAAVAVFEVFVAGYLLTKRVVAAAAAALAFAVSTTFWSQAVIAEIYTFNALMIMLPILALLLWRDRRERPDSDRYLLLAAFSMGFALTNHLTSGLVTPAGFLFVFLIDRRKFLQWKLVLKGIGLFFLGLTPYLFLPIRASMDPAMNEADPTTRARFWEFVSGSDLHGVLGRYGPSELLGRLELYGGHLLNNYHWGLLVVVGMGAMGLILRDRAAAVFLGFLYFGWLAHALEFGIYDTEIYFITTYLALALIMAAGFGFLLEAVDDVVSRLSEDRQSLATYGIVAVLLLVPLWGVWETYGENDMSNDYTGQKINNIVAEKTAPNSTIMHHRGSVWYLTLVEGRRKDLTLIDPWYPSWKRDTDIVWPDDINSTTTNLRYGTNDYTGVSTAFEASEYGAVYILDQESAGASNFRDAGFDIVRVERGILYELVPPGGKRYTSELEARD
jgi:hypothetical protein